MLVYLLVLRITLAVLVWNLAPTYKKGVKSVNEIQMEQPYKVLVRVDDAGRVVEINSDAFVTDTDGWTEVLLP